MHDAILVGIGTALNDNPQLNSKYLFNSSKSWRLVLTRSMKQDTSRHSQPPHPTNGVSQLPSFSTDTSVSL